MITPTTDFELIKNIVLSPQVFEVICEDNIHPAAVTDKDFTDKNWLLFSTAEHPVAGVIAVEPLNNSTIKIHPYLVAKLRSQGLGTQMIKEFFNFFLTTIPEKFIKVNCEIPTCFSDTYKFAKKMGFIDEGKDRASFFKYGSVWDQHCLGLTRAEIAGKEHG